MSIGNLIYATGVDGTATTVSTGNVGIGKSSPGSRLDVNGTITTTGFRLGTSTTAGYALIAGSDGTGTWTALSTGATDIDGLSDAVTLNNSIFLGSSTVANSGTTWATAVGYNALSANTNGGLQNSAFGYQSLKLNSTGDYNTASGFQSLTANTTGSYNTAVGLSALLSNTTGLSNTAVGAQSILVNTAGNFNTAIGYRSLYNNSSSYNTASGYQSLYSNTTGSYNTASGYQSLYNNNTGLYNTASGMSSLVSNTTGSYNTVSGNEAAFYTQTGSNNSIFGYGAGFGTSSTSYSNNSLFGYKAGYALTTGGNNNILVGYQAGNGVTTGAANIVIGYDIDPPSNTASNQLDIGNLIYGTGLSSTGTTISTGNIGIGDSSPSAKLDIAGDIKIGNQSATCSATTEGSQRYDSTNKRMEFCNGTAWVDFGSSGKPSFFHVYRGAAQTGITSTDVKIDWDTEVYDYNSEFDITTNNRFTATRAGVYLIVLKVRVLSLDVDGFVIAKIYKNGVLEAQNVETIGSSSVAGSTTCTAFVTLAVGDYIEGWVRTNNATSKSLSGAASDTYLMGARIMD